MALPQITFLRFLAAVLVVFYHYGSETFNDSFPILNRVIAEGAVAVSFFFFLSGLVIGLNYLGRTVPVRTFWIRRFARIAPLYLFAFVVTFLLQAYFFGDLPRGNAIIAQLFALHAWFPEMCLAINYPAWSISVEVFFYVCFPLALWLYGKWGARHWTIALLLLWVANIAMDVVLRTESSRFEIPGAFVLYFPLWHIGTFAAGLVCGLFVQYGYDKSAVKRWSMPMLLVGLSSVTLLFTSSNFLREVAHNGGAVPCFFLILTGLAFSRNTLSKILSWRPLVLLGDASYAIYLLQFPVYLVFTNGKRSGSLSLGQLSVYLLSLVLISVATYNWFEKPMKRLILERDAARHSS